MFDVLFNGKFFVVVLIFEFFKEEKMKELIVELEKLILVILKFILEICYLLMNVNEDYFILYMNEGYEVSIII